MKNNQQVAAKNNSMHAMIESFIGSFKNWVQNTIEVSKLYSELIDKYPEAKEELKHRLPGVPSRTWIKFEAVGRGYMHPQLISNPHFAIPRLERMSYSDQAKAVEGKMDVLTPKGDTLKVSLSELTPEIAKQVFAHDHIRSLSEQKIYLESKRSAKLKPIATAYKIFKDRIDVVEPCSLKKYDLLRILQEMG